VEKKKVKKGEHKRPGKRAGKKLEEKKKVVSPRKKKSWGRGRNTRNRTRERRESSILKQEEKSFQGQ